jgi:hypothetical protein
MKRIPKCDICQKAYALYYTYTSLTEINSCSKCITDQLIQEREMKL